MITKERKQELRKIGYGELQRQDEFRKFIDKCVYMGCYNMTLEVDYILKKNDNEAPFSYDDFKSFYIDKDEIIEKLMDDYNEMNKHNKKQFLSHIDDGSDTPRQILKKLQLGDIEHLVENELSDLLSFTCEDLEQQTEVYQWFVMDKIILYQLEKRGEIVLNNTYWGRQCCGQAIEMDSVIIEIFKEWWLK